MKVGTDGILLGAWAPVETAGSILDIGAGSGLLALMAAQRNAQAEIHAIEIDLESARQADENFNASPWAHRITLYPHAVQTFPHPYLYDLILCNPPYFKNSLLPTENQKARACHQLDLTFESLLNQVDRLLTETGIFCAIIPQTALNEFIYYALLKDLHPVKLTRVYPHKFKKAHRILLALGRIKTAVCPEELYIYQEDRQTYSYDFQKLTRPYYTIF